MKGILLFLLIQGIFMAGLLFHGSLTPPIIEKSGGGVISVLTFLIQLGNGIMGFLSFGSVLWTRNILESGATPGDVLKFFSGDQTHACYDLGSFYILVSGALNYFTLTTFYDRYKNQRTLPGQE